MEHTNQQDHLPMVGGFQKKEWCKHHQTNSMDPDGPQQNATESRGDPSLPCIREGIGEVVTGSHDEKRQRKYLCRRARVSGRQRNLGKRNYPSRIRIRIQKTGKIQRRWVIHATPKRTNHITRPKENTTGELPHIPNERLDPQDHEGKRIRQIQPM